MYTISVPYTNYKKEAKRKTVSFNLDGREVFKLLPELKSVFDWMESNKNEELRELSVEEVRTFYNNFEHILLESYGEMSEDGEEFDKDGKFAFEKTALFNACMVMFVTKPDECNKMLEGVMPMDLFKMLVDAVPTDATATQDEKDAEIARLRAMVLEGGATSTAPDA